VDGADFAVSSIGGAGPAMGGVYGTAAHSADIAIPARYGIHQIVGDTGGPAGMMMGLRSVPIYLRICREMQARCPRVVLLNHSNPMAVLCRAMIKYGGIENVIGICHGVQGGLHHAAAILGVDPHELDAVWIGTNHYYWFTRLRHRGRDVYPDLMQRVRERRPEPGTEMASRLSCIYGFQIVYPDDAHIVEFYPFLTQCGSPEGIPYGMRENPHSMFRTAAGHGHGAPRDRAAQLAELEAQLRAIEPPDGPSDPITGEGLGRLVEAIASGRRAVHIVNIPNRGCVPNLPEHAVLEVEGVTDSVGVRGVYAGQAPAALAGLLHKRIAWQEMVADAAALGDRDMVVQATLLDEMAIRPDKAEAMVNELLAASRDYLPQFR
jgi:alpha-galactosidase